MTAVMRAMTSPTRTDTGLQQPELAQLAPHRLGHVLGAGRGTLEIGRRVLGFEIAPPLKPPPWPRLDCHALGSEHQVTLADAAFVDIGAHRNELLPASHLATDHPVERAAVDELVGALGNHAGAMQVLGLLAAGAPALLADPILQILDRVTADAELDEMQCHCCSVCLSQEICQETCLRDLPRDASRDREMFRGNKRGARAVLTIIAARRVGSRGSH